MSYKYQKIEKGFSLIEVLVSLLILAMGIAAVVFLMSNNIKSLQNTRDQVIASMLAQEGVELVRNLRDNDPNFTSNGSAHPIDGTNYSIDKDSTALDSGKEGLLLNVDFYMQDAGATAKKFYRRINTVSTSGVDIKVTSYVTWNGVGFGGMGTLPDNCTIGNQCVSVVSNIVDP